jgi:ComF family protein
MRAAEHLTAPDAARARWARFARRAGTLARAALPQACALCNARAGDALVCAACEAWLPRVDRACPRCALPSPGGGVCGACLARAPPYAATIAAHAYAFPVDRLLHALKYGGRLALADWAAGALARAVAHGAGTRVDAIVALPLAAVRQRERGFNQAHEIARRVAALRAIALLPALERIRAGPPQAMLAASARAANVKGAFACVCDVRGLALAVVDDVMTSGATLGEAARALAAAGAARVDAWVVARTPAPS